MPTNFTAPGLRRWRNVAAGGVLLLASCGGEQSNYDISILVPGSEMHGVHGLAFNSKGELFGASLIGQSIYKINLKNGKAETVVGAPMGNSDDLAFGPDDYMVWTGGLEGRVYGMDKSGKIDILAENLPGANSINFGPDGRIYMSTLMLGDTLYEIDRYGETPPKVVADKLGGFNGFEVTDNGTIIGPLMMRGKVVEVTIEDGSVNDVATDFVRPAAVNLDSLGNVIATDLETGEIFRVDRTTGEKNLITKLMPPLDNLAVAPDGKIYVSNHAYNGITEVDLDTGQSRPIVFGGFSSPGGLTVIEKDGKEVLLVSDIWENRTVDAETGAIRGTDMENRLAGSTYIVADDNFIYMSGIWPLPAVQIVDRANGKVVKVIGDFKAPYAIQPMKDGTVLVADYLAGQLVELDGNRKWAKRVVAEGLSGPVGLASAGPKAVYVTEYDSGTLSRIKVRNGDKEIIHEELSKPEGIAIGLDGQIIVAEVGIDTLSQVNPETGDKSRIADQMNFGLPGWAGMPEPFIPSSIAVGKTGILYVTSDMKNTLYRMVPR